MHDRSDKQMRPKRSQRAFLVIAGAALIASSALIIGETFVDGGNAWAVVGRPLTPVSYAGVARRTSRRTTRRMVYGSGAYGSAAYYPAGAVTVLPAGCGQAAMGGTLYYRCGAGYYRPYYDGPNLVYVPTAP